jgi:hypothetical protein
MNARFLTPAGRRVFLITFLVALLFAAYTNHVWEDYYITYRASKNLATGEGLVFNRGDRLHTFTSPLGVLLPALASAATFNSSDTGALWIFRVWSSAAFAGAATLLYFLVLQLQGRVWVAALAVGWLTLDAKSLDFTINGMETGLLLLFIAWTLYAQFGACQRRWFWLGLGWAGLMWTRPDGFLYIGLLSLGGWLFDETARAGLTRSAWLKIVLLAGLVCTAAYLPWFIGSWLYYGTPIPHTITAKASMSAGKTIFGALQTFWHLPLRVWNGETSLPAAFLPSYYMIGGWPEWIVPVAKLLAFVAAFTWLLPFVRGSTRAASLAFCGLHVYLSYYPYFPFPWYLPGTALLACFVLAGLLGQIVSASPRTTAPAGWRTKVIPIALALVTLGWSGWLTTSVARQVAAQQQWVEDGNRRQIGEWLRKQSSPGDTVFMEPLGYIGFFSGLKTYDFPGMSSREMVKAIHAVGVDWATLIDYLGPDWVVLRPQEVKHINQSIPGLLNITYRLEREFDVSEAVHQLSVPGRRYLEFDSHFTVFHRIRTQRFVAENAVIEDRFQPSAITIDQVLMQMIHAPGKMTVKIPVGATHMHVTYGMPAGVYSEPPVTDGATFEIQRTTGAHAEVVFSRHLDPVGVLRDRGLHTIDLDLPAMPADAQLVFITKPGPTDVKDWTCWSRPEFR